MEMKRWDKQVGLQEEEARREKAKKGKNQTHLQRKETMNENP